STPQRAPPRHSYPTRRSSDLAAPGCTMPEHRLLAGSARGNAISPPRRTAPARRRARRRAVPRPVRRRTQDPRPPTPCSRHRTAAAPPAGPRRGRRHQESGASRRTGPSALPALGEEPVRVLRGALGGGLVVDRPLLRDGGRPVEPCGEPLGDGEGLLELGLVAGER